MPYRCPNCLIVSHHPKDSEHGFCARCNAFEGDPAPAAGHYVLQDQRPVETFDLHVWAAAMDDPDRVVAFQEVYSPEAVTLVETFFLGTALWGVAGGRYFFATRCARGPRRDFLELLGLPRLYETWAAAEAGHREVVKGLLDAARGVGEP